MLKQFMAGMGAGTIEAILAVTPMETLKTKMIQTNQSLIPGVRSIFRESGFRGFYQGVVATVLKQSSNQGLRFMFFNKYKELMTDNGRVPLHPLGSLAGGMMAGCFSTLGNNPFDVVKTQMQGTHAKKYKNTLDCFFKILSEEGPLAFYRGVIPRMGRVVPGQVNNADRHIAVSNCCDVLLHRCVTLLVSLINLFPIHRLLLLPGYNIHELRNYSTVRGEAATAVIFNRLKTSKSGFLSFTISYFTHDISLCNDIVRGE